MSFLFLNFIIKVGGNMYQISSNIPTLSINVYHLFQSTEDFRASCSFLCVLKGSLKINLETKEYTLHNEDIIYIPSETKYIIEPTDSCLLLYVNFHPYFLLDSLGFDYTSITYCSLNYTNKNRQLLSNYLATLAVVLLTNRSYNECLILSKAYDLFHHMSLNYMKKESNLSHASKSSQKLTQYKDYLKRNYRYQISLSDVASALDYTPQYLSNFIKKNLNTTFQENLNDLRLQASLLLVKHSEEPVGRIAAICGFPNITSFLKCFESKYNTTPEKYRIDFRNNTTFTSFPEFVPVTNETLILDYIFNYMHYVEKDTSLHRLSIIQKEKVNVSKWTPIEPYWNYMINLGTITDFEKPAYRYSLKIMQNKLHFQYGRCIGLFLLVDEHIIHGQLTYDFSKIFDVIDFLRSIQLKPHFELSDKPFHIYKANETELIDYNQFLDSPRYDEYFFQVFPAFIKACITRYGFDELASWKFELWRRYNPNMTSLESPKDYCNRFQKTAKILKSLVPNASLGGPGFNTFLDTDFFGQLLEPFQNATYLPDFLSAYYFGYVPQRSYSESQPTGYTTVTTSHNMQVKIKELLLCKEHYNMQNIPLYITEYSAYLSQGNYINDSTYPAVFIIQQMIENYGHADVLAYWLACDISLQYNNYSYPLFGGNGIITKNAIPKASFYAFDFLNQLGDGLIAKGEHFIITRSEESIQVLVFYQTNLNHKFASSPFSQELLHYPYSAFEDVLPLDISIHLTHLPSGNYLIKEHTINLTHGNVLSSWGQLNYWKVLKDDEIEYLKHESIPSVKIKNEMIENHYCLQTKLSYNETKLFILEQNI